MQVDVLIVGQGICGSMLSWFLQREGHSVLVIDEAREDSASRVAAGVINPVTGRRYVTSWMAEELIRFAGITYTELSKLLEQPLLYPRSIIDFFPSAQMRNAFVDRISENDTYLHPFPDQNLFNPFFHYDFGCGEVCPAFCVDLQQLLSAMRNQLSGKQQLREERFLANELNVSGDAIHYGNITAQKIVFCDGIAAEENPMFSQLPFSANKGEALIVRCEELTREHIYKRGMMLVPLPEAGLFWFGANYQWEFEDNAPTDTFYRAASGILQQWLKKPFEILAHKAAIRPATLERRPFVGFHPLYPSVGILNGMGTKGTSLAPFFANQLAQHIVHGLPIAPEADVRRFNRILSK